MNFKVMFNGGKQWINVTVWDVHPNTFERWNKTRWGYFQPTWKSTTTGEFGELHFVKSGVRFDTIAHEIFHVIMEYVWANRTAVTSKNEEKYATMTDELCRKLEREFKKQGIKF